MLEKILILTHVCGAVIGLISGALSMIFRKGAGLHRAAGTVFFVAMITMSLSAAVIAASYRPNAGNVTAGMLTFYLVTTSWVAARRRTGGTSRFDLAALAIVIAVSLGDFAFGMRATRVHDPMPTPVYFIFGTIALLFGASDVRMIARGGVIGAKRIARHLWRMGFAFMIALFSLYPGRPQVFPKWLKASGLLYIPHVLLVGSLLFWLVRVSGRKRQEVKAFNPESDRRSRARAA